MPSSAGIFVIWQTAQKVVRVDFQQEVPHELLPPTERAGHPTLLALFPRLPRATSARLSLSVDDPNTYSWIPGSLMSSESTRTWPNLDLSTEAEELPP